MVTEDSSGPKVAENEVLLGLRSGQTGYPLCVRIGDLQSE